MGLIIELILELVVQLLIEVVADAGFRGIGRILSNRVARVALGLAAILGVGYGTGWWWGLRLTELGRTEPPSSLWVSLGCVLGFALLAAVRAVRDTPSAPEPDDLPNRLVGALQPWRWSPTRLAGFALLNASVAIGIAVGFTPLRVR